MLVYITFAYFLFAFIYIVKRRGIDVSACIMGIYMVTSFFNIIAYKTDIEYMSKTPTLIPTIVYCSMITLVTYPFYKFNSNKIRDIGNVNMKVFNVLSWTLIIAFVFAIILFREDIMIRLAMGDEIGYLRGQANRDLGTAQANLSSPLRALSSVFMTVLSMSAVSFILFFYSITFLNKKWYFNLLLFVSSLGCVVTSIIGIDRSVTFYWIIDFIFIYILMRPYMSTKIKRISTIMSSVVISAGAAYLIMMTTSRFGDDSTYSLINYMGQNYLNFCWFWDNYDAPILNFGMFFPITSHFLNIDWGAPVGAVNFGWFVESKVGYFVNLFYTFMGTVMLYLGQWAVIPFCLLYYRITDSFVNNTNKDGVQSFIRLFIFAIVPYCGVILYLYVDYIRYMAFFIMLIFCHYMDKQNEHAL